jgi:probable H4MPT-linked C1 transfer pathway protein
MTLMTRTPPICGSCATTRAATPGSSAAVVGWDIGGVNTKIARITDTLSDTVGDAAIAAAVRPYEIQRDPAALPSILNALAGAVGGVAADLHAVTMTAELSQVFRRKRDGVAFVLDAVAAAFPRADVRVLTTNGAFLTIAAARDAPLAVAAANWSATARVVARAVPTAVLVDIGTTTTDIIPLVDGVVRAAGWTDPDRLRSGELLYLGAVRTPVEAITHVVPLGADDAGVSAEAFALAADVHLWRGTLEPSAYTAPPPDGRATTRDAAGDRLARIVCADRELLDDPTIDRIADAVAAAQIRRTAHAIRRVCARHPSVTIAVVTGVGDFIAAAAAEHVGLTVRWLADEWGAGAARAAPAAAVALLRAISLRDQPAAGEDAARTAP